MKLRIKSRPDLEKAAKEKGKLDEFFYAHCGKPITASKDAVVYNQWFQYGCYWERWMLEPVPEEGKKYYMDKSSLSNSDEESGYYIKNNLSRVIATRLSNNDATLIVAALNQYEERKVIDQLESYPKPKNHEQVFPHPLIGQKVKAGDGAGIGQNEYEGVLLYEVPKPYGNGCNFIVGVGNGLWGYFRHIAPLPSPVTITATIEGDTITHDGRMFREVKG
jgi:hypothetical protein